MVEEHYRAWVSAECVKKFVSKTAGDFFRTETHFLNEIGPGLESVLDIGCSSGRFVRLLETYRADFDYVGMDLVPEAIDLAHTAFPQHRFIVANALEADLAGSFDLVNATGVVQHEPRFERLIERMVEWSRRWVLFDLKAAAIATDLVDRDQSYVTIAGDRLYFVVLSYGRLLESLRSMPGLSTIRIFGYETERNARTTLPQDVAPIASLGVLLELGESDGAVRIEADVPDFLQ